MNIVRFDSPRVMFDFDGFARHIVTATFSSNQRVKENNSLERVWGLRHVQFRCSLSAPVFFPLRVGVQI